MRSILDGIDNADGPSDFGIRNQVRNRFFLLRVIPAQAVWNHSDDDAEIFPEEIVAAATTGPAKAPRPASINSRNARDSCDAEFFFRSENPQRR